MSETLQAIAGRLGYVNFGRSRNDLSCPTRCLDEKAEATAARPLICAVLSMLPVMEPSWTFPPLRQSQAVVGKGHRGQAHLNLGFLRV